MTDKESRRNTIAVISIMIGLTLSPCIILTGIFLKKYYDINKIEETNEVRVDGEITNVDKNDFSILYKVEYKKNGDTYAIGIFNFEDNYEIGDIVEVCYEKNNDKKLINCTDYYYSVFSDKSKKKLKIVMSLTIVGLLLLIEGITLVYINNKSMKKREKEEKREK